MAIKYDVILAYICIFSLALSSLIHAVHTKKEKASFTDSIVFPDMLPVGHDNLEGEGWSYTVMSQEMKYFISIHMALLVSIILRLKSQSSCLVFSWLITQFYYKEKKLLLGIRKLCHVTVDVHSQINRFLFKES